MILLVAVVALVTAPGCALFRRRGANAEGVAAARELSRQGVAAMERGQWQQAEDLLNKSLIGAPDDAATHGSLAEVLWHRGAKPEALAQIEEAVRKDEDNANLRVRAGELSLAAGNCDAAMAHAERAIRSDPEIAAAWALRGRCFQGMNQSDRALADLQHALEFEPDNSDLLLDVATIYRQRGQPARSLTTIHHLLDTYSPGEEPQNVLTLEGLTLLDLGRSHQACVVLEAATRREPPNADRLYYLAHAYLAAGRTEQAASVAQQALTLNAAHQPSRELLAQLAAQTSSNETQRR
jgi:tetratricopeptide (TPR) repeat protein